MLQTLGGSYQVLVDVLEQMFVPLLYTLMTVSRDVKHLIFLKVIFTSFPESVTIGSQAFMYVRSGTLDANFK